MRRFSRTIFRCTRVFPSVFHHSMADVDMTNYVTMHCNVLADNESGNIKYVRQMHAKQYYIKLLMSINERNFL